MSIEVIRMFARSEQSAIGAARATAAAYLAVAIGIAGEPLRRRNVSCLTVVATPFALEELAGPASGAVAAFRSHHDKP